MSAPVRIEAEAWTDLRFATLARILGLADADHALIRTARIWSWQAEHYTPEAPTYVVDLDTIESALGTGGAAALVRARLAEEVPDGYRIRGALGRIEWLYQKRQAARAGGEATRRKHGHKDRPHGQPSGSRSPDVDLRDPTSTEDRDQDDVRSSGEPDNKTAPHGQPHGKPAAEPVASPLVLAPDLVPDQRSELSPSRAILPSPVQAPAATPPVLPAPAVREQADGSAYDPTDPRARGRLAELTYRRISDARVAVAAELGLPAPIPFPAITPGSETRGLVELRARIREEGAQAPLACDRAVENLIAQAREERHIDWLAEQAFGDKAWSKAKDWLPASKRPRSAVRRADPQPASAPPRRPREKPKEIPTGERAGSAELAEAWKALGIAGDPTSNEVEESATTDDKQPRRRKAAT